MLVEKKPADICFGQSLFIYCWKPLDEGREYLLHPSWFWPNIWAWSDTGVIFLGNNDQGKRVSCSLKGQVNIPHEGSCYHGKGCTWVSVDYTVFWFMFANPLIPVNLLHGMSGTPWDHRAGQVFLEDLTVLPPSSPHPVLILHSSLHIFCASCLDVSSWPPAVVQTHLQPKYLLESSCPWMPL